jgi:type VI secretion system protein ImpK
MDRDNPFGENEDLDRTIRQPRLGATAAVPSDTLTAPPRTAPRRPIRRGSIDETAKEAFGVAALNPLVGTASPLLWLASRLSDSLAPEDVEDLRERVLSELRRFDTEALAAGTAIEHVRVARYALAAMIDDIVLHTEWGSQSLWTTKGLVSSLYNETLGGERFFDILEQMMADPNANADVLELMAICIAIGFAGKYRIEAGGVAQLDRLRDQLHRTLRRVRGSYERDLSASWRGLSAPHRSPPSSKLLWIVCAFALIALASIYTVFSLNLRSEADVAIARLAKVVPTESVPIPPVPKPPPAPPPEPPPPAAPTQVERIKSALANDLASGAVQLIVQPEILTLRIPGHDLFAVGKTEIDERVLPVLHDIASALDREPGDIKVVGHSDNTPFRAGPTDLNQLLSLRRAQAVMKILADSLSHSERLSAEGKGDTDPIASNDTAAGRDLNRRVEIVIPRVEKDR